MYLNECVKGNIVMIEWNIDIFSNKPAINNYLSNTSSADVENIVCTWLGGKILKDILEVSFNGN